MGNLFCPAEDVALLAPVARDVCPFPNYKPSPQLVNMLSVNSSLHLKNHYTAVQSSLTPKQLEDFTQGLRTTFGREGKVTLGGVGVVALSLAVLFDTLARQVRGEYVSESEPIPGLFIKDLRGYYPPHVYTASTYLRLVPHIANNPTRMKEETERYHKQFKIDEQSLEKMAENITIPINEDTTAVNAWLGWILDLSLRLHLLRLKNGTSDELVTSDTYGPYDDLIFNLNCDPQIADKDFSAKVHKSDRRTQEAFEICKSIGDQMESFLSRIAKRELGSVLFLFRSGLEDLMIAQREDFDLKANALKTWAE